MDCLCSSRIDLGDIRRDTRRLRKQIPAASNGGNCVAVREAAVPCAAGDDLGQLQRESSHHAHQVGPDVGRADHERHRDADRQTRVHPRLRVSAGLRVLRRADCRRPDHDVPGPVSHVQRPHGQRHQRPWNVPQPDEQLRAVVPKTAIAPRNAGASVDPTVIRVALALSPQKNQRACFRFEAWEVRMVESADRKSEVAAAVAVRLEPCGDRRRDDEVVPVASWSPVDMEDACSVGTRGSDQFLPMSLI